MPTDLQSSTSSSSSIFRKQSSVDGCFLEKSSDESKLSKDFSNISLNKGNNYTQNCSIPLGLKCSYINGALDCESDEHCKIVCSNADCNQSGWIHATCFKQWYQKIESEVVTLNLAVAVSVEQLNGINCWIDLLQNRSNSSMCACNRGTLRLSDSNWVDKALNPNNVKIPGPSGITNTKRKNGCVILPQNHSNFNFLTNGSNQINSSEANSSNVSTNPSTRLRSRTLSATHTSLNTHSDIHLTMNPDLIKKPPTSIKVSNGFAVHKHKTNHRQRRHSSTYHGSNTGTKDDIVVRSRLSRNSTGNIFKQRNDFRDFQKLPFSKQNAYFIQMEDDSCNGNDETKVFILTQLSQHGTKFLKCLICSSSLPIYDHLPLIDGTFFISPMCHSLGRSIPLTAASNPPGANDSHWTDNVSTTYHQLDKYLHAICMHCMHEIVICCQFCHRPWTGARLLIGSLYTYDIFAAVPCCFRRLLCNNCNGLCIDIAQCTDETSTATSTTPSLSMLLSNFSQLSRLIDCKNCHSKDYHLVKPFAEIFKPIRTIT